jgi:hypothetical protein
MAYYHLEKNPIFYLDNALLWLLWITSQKSQKDKIHRLSACDK